ncbi:DUF4387 family protein [Jannaschia sp. Os4]|uniref:DUF4387 family protein n=1 Tax=Jannaschia sp. Os4 TaxID=2807617 RepID=UPI00193951B7|nr:DUF4387 family protein [Jannaschia sp. Os4]MBM2576991.1 DUF4387 family protein [Jannaschia sp. Os4]
MRELRDLARVRSKNAGPFWITLDLFCDDYDAVAAIDTAAFAARLRCDPDAVRRFDLPDLSVVKLSLPRPAPQGAFHDRDMHGAALGAALEGMTVPE